MAIYRSEKVSRRRSLRPLRRLLPYVFRYRKMVAGAVVSLALAAAMTAAPVLSSVLKRLHGRPRPQVMPHLDTVASASFPSGHTMGSVVFCTTLALLIAEHARGRAMALFLACYSALIGALVAASRVYLGVHYPSDVAGGALVAIAWSLTVVLVERWLRREP